MISWLRARSFKIKVEHCGTNTFAMIPFSTTVLIDGYYAEYEISLGDDHYRAILVQYPANHADIPSELLFWQQGRTWVSTTPEARNIVSLLGIAVETYLFKATAYETFS
jgi:hypothetical protein